MIKMSSDGQYQTAVTSNCYVKTSINGGQSWSNQINISRSTSESSASSLEMTADGKMQIISGISDNNLYSYQYKSNNFGGSWTIVTLPTSPSILIDKLSISSDGQYQLGCRSNTKPVYLSKDYGSTWTSVTGLTDSTTVCGDLKISSSGKYQFCLLIPDLSSTTSSIKISSNFGLNWTAISISTERNLLMPKISISSSGKYVIINDFTVMSDYNLLYFSSNYGNTFTSISSIYTWIKKVNISGDGNYSLMIASTGSGTTLQSGIYTSKVFSFNTINQNIIINSGLLQGVSS